MKISKKLLAGFLCAGLLGVGAQSKCNDPATECNDPAKDVAVGILYASGACLLSSFVVQEGLPEYARAWFDVINKPSGESFQNLALQNILMTIVVYPTYFLAKRSLARFRKVFSKKKQAEKA